MKHPVRVWTYSTCWMSSRNLCCELMLYEWLAGLDPSSYRSHWSESLQLLVWMAALVNRNRWSHVTFQLGGGPFLLNVNCTDCHLPVQPLTDQSPLSRDFSSTMLVGRPYSKVTMMSSTTSRLLFHDRVILASKGSGYLDHVTVCQ